VELERQSKAATEEARATGDKKQIVPPELLEEVFELNMQLEEARANKKLGEEDAALTSELQNQKRVLEAKFEALFEELRGYWNDWDSASEAGSESLKKQARDRMVDLLNRRSYIRNLVRDVNEVLGS
jgi:molecular chaperone HscB